MQRGGALFERRAVQLVHSRTSLIRRRSPPTTAVQSCAPIRSTRTASNDQHWPQHHLGSSESMTNTRDNEQLSVPAIDGLLGHDVLAKHLLQRLRDPDTRLSRLGGPSGAGKTHVAHQVASVWVKDGGACVVAVGDHRNASRALYPLLSGLSQAPPDWRRIASLGTRSAIGVADTALGDAGVGMGIFDLLAGTFRQRIDRVLKPYSSIERGVILDLRRLGHSRPILLIADNAHWWDADALHLLQLVVRRRAARGDPAVVVLGGAPDRDLQGAGRGGARRLCLGAGARRCAG